ncbi:hypothetical protein C7H19_15350 [Aphanothece hegewaldii CCALA 016]|uniref:Uncharacterized protein n=1 Tax=Aphanothece hegewaldii CCALA 016 TaxID=2107694 RepID=A0A2T1LVP0_9CHRO|nr:hypothetical protein [Aphanothece hegewaldii]PSF35799.1 hypothetical protein C7H19_15350 [Aphanothece hegewaldii CCALA 016]
MYFFTAELSENPFLENYNEQQNEVLIKQLEAAVNKSQEIADSWDEIWQRSFHLVLPSGDGDVAIAGNWLFGKLCTLGFWIALSCVIFYGFSQYKYWLEGNYLQYILSIFNPLIVVIFLSNNGALMVGGFELLRNVGNYANEQILTGSLQGMNLQNAFRLANASFGFKYAFNTQLEQCMSYSGDIQTACINNLVGQAEAMKDFLLKESIVSRYEGSFFDKILPGASQLLDPEFWESIGKQISPFNVLGNDLEAFLFSVLKSLLEAYQHLMEVALILMGYMLPLTMGCLLLPFGANVILSWISGYIAIIIANLSYNGVTGLMATSAVFSTPDDPLPFATVLGLYAPVLASAIAAGGGAAIWSGISSATSGAISAGFDVASTALKLVK